MSSVTDTAGQCDRNARSAAATAAVTSARVFSWPPKTVYGHGSISSADVPNERRECAHTDAVRRKRERNRKRERDFAQGQSFVTLFLDRVCENKRTVSSYARLIV